MEISSSSNASAMSGSLVTPCCYPKQEGIKKKSAPLGTPIFHHGHSLLGGASVLAPSRPVSQGSLSLGPDSQADFP